MLTWLDELANNATPSIDECVEILGDAIHWLTLFKETPQDPEWHAEGNVHIHTGMVLDELYKLLASEAQHIQGWRRQALILGALLHDIGKPVRTKDVEIRGVMRVASPQHEAIGRSYLAFKLMSLDLPFKVVWHVLALVGEHHMPKQLVVKNRDRGDYIALSRRGDLALLYWLEVADMRGRICPDLVTQLEYLDEFKMFAQEYGVWESTFEFTRDFHNRLEALSAQEAQYLFALTLRDLEAGSISMAEEGLARHYESKRDYANLIVLCGPSGIGKSSWISNNCKGHEIISLDDIREEVNGCRSDQSHKGRVLALAKERLKSCLRKSQDVVWDATNLRSDFRKVVCDLGRDYNALVTLVVFLAAEDAIFKGNRERTHSIPENILVKQLSDYQFPLVSEAHRFVVVVMGATVYESGFWNGDIRPW